MLIILQKSEDEPGEPGGFLAKISFRFTREVLHFEPIWWWFTSTLRNDLHFHRRVATVPTIIVAAQRQTMGPITEIFVDDLRERGWKLMKMTMFYAHAKVDAPFSPQSGDGLVHNCRNIATQYGAASSDHFCMQFYRPRHFATHWDPNRSHAITDVAHFPHGPFSRRM